MSDLQDHLKRQLMFDEGRVRLPTLPGPTHYAYRDTVNKWTTGYGFNLQDRVSAKVLAKVTTKTVPNIIKHKESLTEEEALALLDNQIATAEKEAASAVRSFDKLSDVRKFVVVCLVFQMGLKVFSQFENAIAALNDATNTGDFSIAAKEFQKSRWARQVPKRAKRMTTALEKGSYPRTSFAPERPSVPAPPTHPSDRTPRGADGPPDRPGHIGDPSGPPDPPPQHTEPPSRPDPPPEPPSRPDPTDNFPLGPGRIP